MADRPILFSPPMVRALLSGHKFQTRRIINFAGIENVLDFVKVATDMEGRPVYEMKDANGQHVARPAGKGLVDFQYWPRFGVGDRLYVREEFSGPHEFKPKVNPPKTWPVGCDIWYWADGNPEHGDWNTPKRAMHMPRWASRITLPVREVRVERLQDISGVDAIAEGITCHNVIVDCHGSTGVHVEITDDRYFYDGCDDEGFEFAEDAYFSLWDRINGAGAADANPWVVATTFEVLTKNIDEVA